MQAIQPSTCCNLDGVYGVVKHVDNKYTFICVVTIFCFRGNKNQVHTTLESIYLSHCSIIDSGREWFMVIKLSVSLHASKKEIRCYCILNQMHSLLGEYFVYKSKTSLLSVIIL